MLRDAEDAPAAFTQLAIHFPVTFPVACDLGFPKLFVPVRRPIALRASMPKASVYENHHPLLSESEVGLPWELEMSPPSGNALLPVHRDNFKAANQDVFQSLRILNHFDMLH